MVCRGRLEIEFVCQFLFPLVHQRWHSENERAFHHAAGQVFLQHKPGFDGFAQTDLIGEQSASAQRSQDPERGAKLVLEPLDAAMGQAQQVVGLVRDPPTRGAFAQEIAAQIRERKKCLLGAQSRHFECQRNGWERADGARRDNCRRRSPVVAFCTHVLRGRARSLRGSAPEPFAPHAFLRLALTGQRFLLLAALLFLPAGRVRQGDEHQWVSFFDFTHRDAQRTELDSDVASHIHHFVLKPAPFRDRRRQLQRFNHWFVAVRISPGTRAEGCFGDREPLAQTHQPRANAGAVERGQIALRLFAGDPFPGQLLEAGAADSKGGLMRRGFDARPVELNATADVIQRDNQSERRGSSSRIWPRGFGRRQSQFRLRRL